jgi:RND family efflux transporter MFP subunit
MALETKKLTLIGKALGGLLLVAAVIAVFFIKWKPEIETVEVPVRPIKSRVLGDTELPIVRTYPGRVRANREVDLAFEVSGRITNLFVGASTQVTNGQLLAALDARDFVDNRRASEAELRRAESHLSRIQEARKKNAVSEQDLSDAQSAYEVARSQLNMRSKAVEDTRLRALFTGIISKRFVDRFESVQAKQPIFGLQSTNKVNVEFFLPESRISMFERKQGWTEEMYTNALNKLFVAEFDYYPNRRFELKVKELNMVADPDTQTFKFSFTMESPYDLVILPGMTVNVHEQRGMSLDIAQKKAFPIPLDAVPVDGLGQYFVWLLEADNVGFHKAKRLDVEVGDIIGDEILVVSGLENGQRIALAGASVLKEGQQVRLLSEESK